MNHEPRISRLDRVGLPTSVRSSRKLYEIDQRNKSETVPLNSPPHWSLPLIRMRIQTPEAKPRCDINARKMRYAAARFPGPARRKGGNPRRGFRNENPFSSQGKTLAKRDNAFMRGCVNTTTKL
ncbi:hypothetical protein LA080_007580 [Diaporthe eres]|nr:hypothetical protein LA080_007580 [Diaporthe eres]